MNGSALTLWRDPISPARLWALLGELEQVERERPGHDMGALFDDLNALRQRQGRALVRLDEFMQVMHAVRVSLSGEPSAGWTTCDLLYLNRHLRNAGGTRVDAPEVDDTALSKLLAGAMAVTGATNPAAPATDRPGGPS